MGSLHKCLRDRRYHQFVYLVKLGTDVEELDEDLQTPIFKVIDIDNNKIDVKLMHLLLKAGAKADLVDPNGLSLVHLVCKKNKVSLLRVLLQTVPDMPLHSKDRYGNTPLHYAAAHQNSDLVNTLILLLNKYQVDLDDRNQLGFTPLLIAASNGCLDVARVLYRNGRVSAEICDGLYFLSTKQWLKMHYHPFDAQDILNEDVSCSPRNEVLIAVEKQNLVPIETRPAPSALLRSFTEKMRVSSSGSRKSQYTAAIGMGQPRRSSSASSIQSKALLNRRRQLHSSQCGMLPDEFVTSLDDTKDFRAQRLCKHCGSTCWCTLNLMCSIRSDQLSQAYRKTIIPTWTKIESDHKEDTISRGNKGWHKSI